MREISVMLWATRPEYPVVSLEGTDERLVPFRYSNVIERTQPWTLYHAYNFVLDQSKIMIGDDYEN